MVGVDPDSGERAMYIGESEDVSKRLNEHKDKDFWNAATVFSSKDENLTKAHIRYLEGQLIEKAKSLSQTDQSVVVMNAKESGAKLPESDAAEMNVFLEKCLQLLPVLGISDFEEKEQQISGDQSLLFCKIKGLTAKGKRTANGFIVYAGSQAVLEHRPSAKRMAAKRDGLVEKGILKEVEGALVFTQDVVFGSPSTAGSVVRGGNTNGLTNWKNSAGVQLKELEAAEGE
ncbi:GIY-YIG nuclease family protein [Aliamphritea spongicola]|nr:GIY-YIG nuclease family protein [Aliamphritea spongicola]